MPGARKEKSACIGTLAEQQGSGACQKATLQFLLRGAMSSGSACRFGGSGLRCARKRANCRRELSVRLHRFAIANALEGVIITVDLSNLAAFILMVLLDLTWRLEGAGRSLCRHGQELKV